MAKVKISTSIGDIVVKLYDETLLHRDNFVKLASEGYDLVKLVSRDVVHDLCENVATDVHTNAVFDYKGTPSIQIKKSKNALKPLSIKDFLSCNQILSHH